MSAVERREYLVGIATALVLALILVFTALGNRRAESVEGDAAFTVVADFGRADGLYLNSPVRLAGMNVGKVSKAVLTDNHAVITMRFDAPQLLPEDTAAVIETDGLFGTKYVELRPGGDDKMLPSGARISFTQDSVILEDLIALIVARAKAKTPPEAESAPK